MTRSHKKGERPVETTNQAAREAREQVTQLDGLRQKVFLDRYSVKDDQGRPTEEYPEQMWRRVAAGIASVEATPELRATWTERFNELLRDFKFVPGGRILSGAGTQAEVTCYNCMPPEQDVLTEMGYRPIGDVAVGDLVVTHRNRLRRVLHVFERQTSEPVYIIEPRKLGFDALRVTGEHPVLAIRAAHVNAHRSRDGLRLAEEPSFIKASELRPGDYVAAAHNAEGVWSDEKITISLLEYLPDGHYTSRVDDAPAPVGVYAGASSVEPAGDVAPCPAYTPTLVKTSVRNALVHTNMAARVVVDERLMLLFGRWLGDGCVTHRTATDIPSGIQIAFHADEEAVALEMGRIITDVFGVPTSITRGDTQRCIWLWANSLPLGQFFKAYFGAYSYGKAIPPSLMGLGNRYTGALLKGLFQADGYTSGTEMGMALANRVLATQVHSLLLRHGAFFSIYENTAKLSRHPVYRLTATGDECAALRQQIFGTTAPATEKPSFKSYLEYDGLRWVHIDRITAEPYEGTVLDIEVEEDHSFISAGVAISNCFVVPSPEDSRAGIMDNVKTMIDIMARGGGVGVNLSTLRPRGSHVKTVNGTSSGPVPWGEMYSTATGKVVQQGGSRRGALMLMLDDNHPDVEEFITAKAINPLTSKPDRLEHANISVAISDPFMEAVKRDADWELTWGGKVYRTVKARYLWDLICEMAWKSADPGLVFMDRVNKMTPAWYFETQRCVNPCGEQSLPPWGVCNLGAINLAAFVRGGAFDYPALAQASREAMRFLDNVVDYTHYFIPENEQAQKYGARRTGLGTMGLADTLIMLEVAYGSPESVTVVDRIFSTIRDAAYEASAEIAAEKGPFPKFDADKHLAGPFVQALPDPIKDKIRTQGLRNAVLLTQAPTGTTSLLAGVSSGIEPVYDFAMKRVDRIGEHIMYHPLLQEWMAAHPGEERPAYFVGAKDLTPEEHVVVQAEAQKYTDASISKTINGPNHNTVEDVKRLYMLAYDLGCKGVTYYRDGSRDAVLTSVETKPAKAVEVVAASTPKKRALITARPPVLHGYTRNVKAPEGTANITINSDEEGPLEVFVAVGRAGSDIAALAEALGRLISLTLRLPSDMSPDDRLREVAGQLRGIGGSRSIGFGPERVLSLPDAVAQALVRHLDELLTPPPAAQTTASPPQESRGSAAAPAGTSNGNGNGHGHAAPAAVAVAIPVLTGNICPSCGSSSAFVFEEGCKKCHGCGYSEC